jgi:hypothetical protein
MKTVARQAFCFRGRMWDPKFGAAGRKFVPGSAAAATAVATVNCEEEKAAATAATAIAFSPLTCYCSHSCCGFFFISFRKSLYHYLRP